MSEELEPRVRTADVRRAIQGVILPKVEDEGESVTQLAERCRPPTSTRTVYRVLGVEKETISLDLADRLLVAAGASLVGCQLQWVDKDSGTVLWAETHGAVE